MFHVMILLVTPVLVGVAVGYATGGRLANLPWLRLRALWLLWLATAVQAAQYDLPWLRWLVQDDLGIPLLAIVVTIVARWGGRHHRRMAAPAVAGGRPDPALLVAGRRPSAPSDHPGGPKNQPADDGTRLAFLGEVIPCPPSTRSSALVTC
jgi:hypothetical protein